MNLDVNIGRDKLVMMAPNSPIATVAVPIAVVMVVPVFIIPVVIGTIHFPIPIFMVPMMIIDPLVISACCE
jgi:hypothetical protein